MDVIGAKAALDTEPTIVRGSLERGLDAKDVVIFYI
jgi:hypothetical protein